MKTTITTAAPSACFSPARFAAYFRLYVLANKRKLLLAVAQMIIITFIFYLFCFYMGGESSYAQVVAGNMKNYDPMWSVGHEIRITLAFVFAALSGSWMYSAVVSKRTRLMTFEIPASQLEKFLTWWLIYVPIFLVMMLVCFYLADVLRVVWIKIGSDYGSYAHILPLKNLITFTYAMPYGQSPDKLEVAQSLCSAFTLIIGINSLFSLGSIFFSRLNFLKTMGSLFVLLIVFSLLSNFGFNLFYGSDTYNVTSRFSNGGMTAIVQFSCGVAAICAYIYWLGYARFKDTEIVNRW